MINKIIHLNEIGIFKSFKWDKNVLEFSKINIILGYNGTGKSTLSNIFNLFSTKREDDNDELLKNLVNDQDSSIELLINKKKIKYKPSCQKEDIYVFNSEFVKEHIFDGTQANLKEFDSSVVTQSQLTNPEIKKIADEINSLSQKNSEIASNKISIEKIFDEIKSKYSIELNTRIIGTRMPTLDINNLPKTGKNPKDLREELNRTFEKYDIAEKQNDLKNDIETLKNLVIEKINLNFNEIKELLLKNISKDLGEKIKNKIDNFSEFTPEYSTLNEWFEDGYKFFCHLTETENKNYPKCPLCDSDIKLVINKLIEEYQAFFNNAYNNFQADLNEISSKINKIKKQFLADKDVIYDILELHKKYKPDTIIPEDNKPDTMIAEHNKYSAVLDEANNFADQLLNNIDEKKSKIDREISIQAGDFEKYNKIVDGITGIKDKLLEKLEKEIKYNPNTLKEEARQLLKELCIADFDTSNKGDQIDKYTKLKIDENSNSKKIKEAQKEIKKQISDLKNESKYVNGYLKKLGINHFSINIDQTQKTDNIEIHYNTGKAKQGLRYSISAGEKTALAFAYFLSKIDYEVFGRGKDQIKNTIIVIDDPISSLDENRLYSTAFLINERFKETKQIFILSHNLVFLKHLSNIIGDHKDTHKNSIRRDYILASYPEPSIKQLPVGLTNYLTSYFTKLQDIIKYVDHTNNEITYDEAKKFLPNYIRVVLETFLSFKFFILKQGSSSEKYQFASFDKLIKTLEGKTHLFDNFQSVNGLDSKNLLKKLANIKKVTDPQSHGTPQNIELFNYIDEVELIEIAQDTLNIINFLDQIHFGEIKS